MRRAWCVNEQNTNDASCHDALCVGDTVYHPRAMVLREFATGGMCPVKTILFVLDDPSLLDEILDAWHDVGIHGVTILESTGLHRRRAQRGLVGARYSFGVSRVAEGVSYEGHYTLLAVVPDANAVQQCLTAAETVVGDLDDPDTGMLVAWDLDVTKGVPADLRSPETGE